ncbi:MAG: polyhydroxyalkanoate synthesis regulator DNA-binding domain-containing protein [Vicinamibacterales bacterium]
MDRQSVVIKKYGNRRLYDITHSRYVNLDEVAQMVREGRDVQVFDATTGEDRTRAILTQIVVEQAKGDESPFPLDVLRQMVAATGRATNEAALTYMNAALELYQNAYRTISPIAGVTPPAPTPAAPPPAQTPAQAPAPGQEMGALLRRLEELEARLGGAGKPGKPGTPRRGKKR